MKIAIEPGRYVVAVSGGVDSMSLLHKLAEHPDVQLTVAHFDHGIREESREDRLIVQEAAKQYRLPFVYKEGKLGANASEALARQARYDFLHKVRNAAGAQAIVTAHHRDDVLETAIINIIRGTGRRGMTSLQSMDVVKRPLLHVSKAELRTYAQTNGLVWREDRTNANPKYLRNHIRHELVPKLSPTARKELHLILTKQSSLNQKIDEHLAVLLKSHLNQGKLDRRWFIGLPHDVSREIMAAWLRKTGNRNFDKKMLERLTHGAKILRVGRRVQVNGSTAVEMGKDFLALVPVER